MFWSGSRSVTLHLTHDSHTLRQMLSRGFGGRALWQATLGWSVSTKLFCLYPSIFRVVISCCCTLCHTHSLYAFCCRISLCFDFQCFFFLLILSLSCDLHGFAFQNVVLPRKMKLYRINSNSQTSRFGLRIIVNDIRSFFTDQFWAVRHVVCEVCCNARISFLCVRAFMCQISPRPRNWLPPKIITATVLVTTLSIILFFSHS